MADSRHPQVRAVRRTSPGRSVTVLLAPAAAGLLLFGYGMPSALAHDELVDTSPADGTSVATAPASVELRFSGAIQPLGTEVLVTGPDGALVSDGTVEIADGTVVAPLAADRPAGSYAVRWRATSSDGHPLTGTFAFTVEEGEAPPPTGSTPDPGAGDVDPVSADEPSTSSPSVGLLAAGALLVAAGGLAIHRLRRRR